MTETLEPISAPRTSNVASTGSAAPSNRVSPLVSRDGSNHGAGAVRARWRRLFTSEAGRARAAAESFTAEDSGWREFALGRAALAEARQIDSSGANDAVALLLYRAALGLLLNARALRLRTISPTEQLRAATLWEQYLNDASGAQAARRLTGEQLPLVAALLQKDAFELPIANLPNAEREQTALGIAAIASVLALELEQQRLPLRRFERRRWSRLAVAAFALTLIGAVVWDRVAPRKNFALHGQVSVTNNIDELAATPNQLVDGDRGSLGFHTDDAPNRSATIDLGHIVSVNQVIVYNRADCCQERAVPLWIEVSQDGVNFTRVARRQTPFLRWQTRIIESKTRYVRLTHEAAGHFHLSEVEVY